MAVLECKALTKNYGHMAALDSVDFAIEPGRIVGLLGLSAVDVLVLTNRWGEIEPLPPFKLKFTV